MSELIENHVISSKLSKVSKCNNVTKEETASSFKSLGSVVIEEDTCKIQGTPCAKKVQYV